MLNTANSRLVVGVPVATAIVYGLFTMMNSLVAVDEVVLPEEAPRVLTNIPVPEEKTTEIKTRESAPKPESTPKPPPPPAHTARKSDIDLPVIDISGQAPARLAFDSRITLAVTPVAVNDREIQPLSPPIVAYPQVAITRGIEGNCDVRFDVDVRGRPFNIEPSCTNSVFDREAKRAIGKVQFAPKIIRGQAKERRNVVYPITFRLPD